MVEYAVYLSFILIRMNNQSDVFVKQGRILHLGNMECNVTISQNIRYYVMAKLMQLGWSEIVSHFWFPTIVINK